MRTIPPCPTALASLAGLAVLWAAAAGAAEPAAPLGAAVLAQATALASQAARALAPRGARIEVLAGALDPRLQLAPCAQVQPFLLAGVSPWGRSRVGLRCVQGAVAWQVSLPVTVQVWAPAVIAGVPLPAGARLDPSQLTMADVDWAAATSAAHASAADLADRVLARPLAAGQAVRGSDLRARQWFGPGETVTLIARGPGFAVASEGQALGAGIEGQPVRVRTESGRVVTGLAVAERRVELPP